MFAFCVMGGEPDRAAYRGSQSSQSGGLVCAKGLWRGPVTLVRLEQYVALISVLQMMRPAWAEA